LSARNAPSEIQNESKQAEYSQRNWENTILSLSLRVYIQKMQINSYDVIQLSIQLFPTPSSHEHKSYYSPHKPQNKSKNEPYTPPTNSLPQSTHPRHPSQSHSPQQIDVNRQSHRIPNLSQHVE